MQVTTPHRLKISQPWLGAIAGAFLLAAVLAPAQAELKDGKSAPAGLKTWQVQSASASMGMSFDGAVEALRQTVVAAQVAGAVVALEVKAGDRVKAGQVLMRLDAKAAEQSAAANEAQAQAARASLQLAQQDLERQQQLFKRDYISRAALEQAEAQFKASQAQVNAQLAQLAVARTQSGLGVVRSPYDGLVSELPVALGDMAMPGRPLATVYDPRALRVTTHLPQSVASALSGKLASPQGWRVDIPGLGATGLGLEPLRVQLLPNADAASHTMVLRLDLPLPLHLSGLVPGMFARVSLPVSAVAAAPAGLGLWVPRSALLRRAELDGLYVIAASGKPLLRQVRLGAVQGDRVEVLSGLSAGERIALEPQVAAQVR